MTTLIKEPKVAANDPTKAGKLASKRVFFGPFSLYAVYAVHTRFESVQWFVTDTGHIDLITNRASVIRQSNSFMEAIAGLASD